MKLNNGVILFGSAIFLPVLTLGLLAIFGGADRPFLSPGLHAFFEGGSTLIGLFFAFLAIRGFYTTGSRRLLFIALGLSTAGILYFLHSLTLAKFWPGANPLEEHVWYGDIAAAILASILFVAAAFDEHLVAPWARFATVIGSMFLFVFLICISIFVTEEAIAHNISIIATVGRWTPLGQFVHLVIITFLALAALRFLHGAFTIRSEISLMFATGVTLLLMGELTVNLSTQLFDLFYWMSHVWRMLGYLSFFSGLFIARRHIHLTDQIRPLHPKN